MKDLVEERDKVKSDTEIGSKIEKKERKNNELEQQAVLVYYLS